MTHRIKNLRESLKEIIDDSADYIKNIHGSEIVRDLYYNNENALAIETLIDIFLEEKIKIKKDLFDKLIGFINEFSDHGHKHIKEKISNLEH